MRSLGLMLCAGLVLALATSARADLIVTNPDFTTPTTGVTSSVLTGAHHGGPSAAADWGTWNNSNATTTTALMASTLPGGGPNMIHVTTTGSNNGLVQVLAPQNTGPGGASASVMVYVLSGHVGIGTGNGGFTSNNNAISTTTNTWQLLRGFNSPSQTPVNELVIYSYGGAADFYVASASVQATPEPSTLLSSTLGILFSAFGFRRWRAIV
jgi:hypothetical protein